jgi:rod shape-determining protein MreC
VVTSGLGLTFPKGLTVGYLLESKLESNGLSREASVVPAADLTALETVFVLTGGGPHAP